MSVGGTIIDIVQVTPSRWWIDTADKDTSWGTHSTTAVYCDPAGYPIEVGDKLWWQSKTCFWTSAKHSRIGTDIPLKKLSYSGVLHPDLATNGKP
jgi:hypothetical protein